MGEAWKKHDRPCRPCKDCGAELYEKFWGNGGWTATEKGTERPHDERDCIRRLRGELNALTQAVLASLADPVLVAMANDIHDRLLTPSQDAGANGGG